MFTNGRAIKKRRTELRFTKGRMGEVLDLSKLEIDYYESGGVIDEKLAEEISWFLHCEVSDITYEEI